MSDLVAKIRQVTRSLPEAHLLTPAAGELFESREAALLRLHNWAFTQGFAVVTQSGRKNRSIFECIHHGKKTKDGLLDAPKKTKPPAKRRKPGKKDLQAAREMSQLLDAYAPPPSNTVILNS
jgi:hypothetical protein